MVVVIEQKISNTLLRSACGSSGGGGGGGGGRAKYKQHIVNVSWW